MATSLTKKPRSKKVKTRTFRKKTYRKKTYRKKRIKRKKSSRKKMRRGGVGLQFPDEEEVFDPKEDDFAATIIQAYARRMLARQFVTRLRSRVVRRHIIRKGKPSSIRSRMKLLPQAVEAWRRWRRGRRR